MTTARLAHKRRPARLLPAQHQLNRNVHKARAIEDECTHNRSERATQAKEMRAHKDTALRTPLRKALERQQQSAGFHHIAVSANLTLSAREANRRRLARERGNSTLWAICACARGVASEITSKYGTRNGAKIKSTICSVWQT